VFHLVAEARTSTLDSLHNFVNGNLRLRVNGIIANCKIIKRSVIIEAPVSVICIIRIQAILLLLVKKLFKLYLVLELL